MDILTPTGRTGDDPNAFLSGLLDFCVDSVATCASRGAVRPCVLIGVAALSALLVLLSCLQLACARCKHRGGHPAEAMTSLYCLLGDLSGTTGAILSKQLHVPILMGSFCAAVDAVSLASGCLLLCLCSNSQSERRRRMMRKRRRQNLLAVCVLVTLAGGFLGLGPGVSDNQAETPGGWRRRLLHVGPQDRTEILGYILGMMSLLIAFTSRLPALLRAHRGQTLTKAHVFSGVLCSLASALYAAAILLCGTQLGFLLRVMPWLLSALCTAALELLILVFFWCKRGTKQQLMRLSPVTESLLGDSGISVEEKTVMKRHQKQQDHPAAHTKAKNIEMVEMGRYMDVSIPSKRKTSPTAVTLSREQANDRPLNRMVRVAGVDGLCSSDTSYESSVVSTDLEWDFEEGNARWSETKAEQQEGDRFPLQEWPRNPKPFNSCTYATSGHPQNSASTKEESLNGCAASLAK